MNLHAPAKTPQRPSGQADSWWLDHVIAWATRQTPAQVWFWSISSALILGVIDRYTGDAIWIGPLYLLVICLPAWALGWRQALLFGFGCMMVTLSVNDFNVHAGGNVGAVWNMSMRYVSIGTIIVLVSGFRRSYDREWHRARTDALTGGLNREALYERAVAGQTSNSWGVLAYIDLDGFKSINDEYGHATGDDILRTFAREMRANIRSSDSFARIGGDEFLVYMHADSEADGYRVAQQIHARMNALPLAYPIKCSMGAMVLHPDACTIDDANVNIADRLMYQAKQDGGGIRIITVTPDKASDTDVDAAKSRPVSPATPRAPVSFERVPARP